MRELDGGAGELGDVFIPAVEPGPEVAEGAGVAIEKFCFEGCLGQVCCEGHRIGAGDFEAAAVGGGFYRVGGVGGDADGEMVAGAVRVGHFDQARFEQIAALAHGGDFAVANGAEG